MPSCVCNTQVHVTSFLCLSWATSTCASIHYIMARLEVSPLSAFMLAITSLPCSVPCDRHNETDCTPVCCQYCELMCDHLLSSPLCRANHYRYTFCTKDTFSLRYRRRPQESNSSPLRLYVWDTLTLP